MTADIQAAGRDEKAKRIRALIHLRRSELDEAVRHAELALEMDDLPTANHLILALAEAGRGNDRAARKQLELADSTWPPELRKQGDYIASADKGFLWFETADELVQLRVELADALGLGGR